jgi:predicted PurR-regulated permease PerM
MGHFLCDRAGAAMNRSSPNQDGGKTLRERSLRVFAAGVVVVLLYFGQTVLIPFALALMLSLLLLPLVRALRRVRLGRTSSVLVAVLVLALCSTAIAVVLGAQILHTAQSLPQYETNVKRKLESADEATLGRLRVLTNAASRLIETRGTAEAPVESDVSAEHSVPARSTNLTPRATSEVAPQPLRLMGKLLRSLWAPVQATGIVLLVLIFVLLEQESLRDRFIRIVGATGIRSTTAALQDASQRLSRYFVSQFTVNLAFGAAVWVSLRLLGVPQAMLCGALAAVMRFVPYVGSSMAALFATALAFAVDPGWSLALGTLGAFILLDMVVGQLVEPRLYGHATGLSPLSVVIAAIFWSSLWGPVGLILSTPLTLCLLVAGRHVKALSILELLLGDAQPLSLSQRFYQRALSADPHEVLVSARAFLRKDTLAAYCDQVLLPALHFAHIDVDSGMTTPRQQRQIRRVIVDVVSALTNNSLKIPTRRRQGSVLESVSAGRLLREQRERGSGRWQGPLGVPPGSVAICVGMGSTADDLASELLVRILRTHAVDARHFSPPDLERGLPSGADPDGVSIVYLVSAFPSPEREHTESIGKQVQELLPLAQVVKVFCTGVTAQSESPGSERDAAPLVNSLVQAIQLGQSWRDGHREQFRVAGSHCVDIAHAAS